MNNHAMFIFIINLLPVMILAIIAYKNLQIPSLHFQHPWLATIFSDIEFSSFAGKNHLEKIDLSSKKKFQKINTIKELNRSNNFSIRLETCFKLEEEATLRIHAKADDLLYLLLNGTKIDQVRKKTKEYNLIVSEGYHYLNLEYLQKGRGAFLDFGMYFADNNSPVSFYHPLNKVRSRKACVPTVFSNRTINNLKKYFKIDHMF